MEFGTPDRKEPAKKVLNKIVAKCVGLSRKISSNIRRHVGKRLKRQPLPVTAVMRTRVLSEENMGEWDALSVPETQRKMMAKRTLAYMDPETGTWVSRGSGSGSSANAGSRSSRMAHETGSTITSLENNESYQIPLKENTFDALFPERPSHDGVAAIIAPRVSISTTHKSALFLTRTASRRTAVTFNSSRSSLSSRRPRRSTTRSRASSRSVSRSRSHAPRRSLLRDHLVDRLAELARTIHESASLDVEQVAAQLNQLQRALGVQTNKANSTATSSLLEEPVHNEAIEAPDIPKVSFGDSDWEDVDTCASANYASVLPRSHQQLTGLRSIRLANNITITNQLVSPPSSEPPTPAPLPQHPHPATVSPSPSPSPPPHPPHAPPSEMDDPGLRKYQSSSSISSTSTVTVKTLRRQTKDRDISPARPNATRKIKNCAVRKRPDSQMRSRGQHSSSVAVRKRRTSHRGSGPERSQAEQLDLILALLQRIRMES
ncbi:hypothetical protein BC832DRAFT_542409 [Gaertneriomyces semiglobifer]|nr:hypothetical protein BC832DRAFT_542409 [Gaertneriomyces semiglobifer]